VTGVKNTCGIIFKNRPHLEQTVGSVNSYIIYFYCWFIYDAYNTHIIRVQDHMSGRSVYNEFERMWERSNCDLRSLRYCPGHSLGGTEGNLDKFR
jgi:hypothetical protein